MMQEPFLRKIVLVGMGVAVVVAAACFVAAAVVPDSEAAPVVGAIKGFVTGLGVLAIAYPVCALALAIRRRGAGSPYYETGFIATAINVFGLACIGTGLACIGFAAYDLIRLLTGPS